MSKYVGVVFPVKIVPDTYFNKVTDIFGIRKWRKEKYGGTGMHSGIDLGTPLGTSVKSPYRGIVTRVSYEVKNAGNVLKIKHDDGFETQYLHLQSILVNEGDEVKSGQKVALTGNSDGNTERSTGPHLHFEVHVNNKKVDPAPYLYGYSLEDGRIINGKQQFVPSKNTVFDKRAIANLNDVKIDGSKISSKQTENANTIVNVCKDLGGSKRDAIIAIATALQESRLMNLNYGDRDSVGLFQQRTSQGWGSVSQITNPTYSATAFFNGAGTNKGLFDYKGRNSVSVAKAAQWVQKSAYPDAYAKWEDEATKIVDYLWGDIVDSFLNEYATESDKNTREELKIEDYLASGIWQIIKVVIDPEVVDKQINDATIAFTQGSLYNFFEKVCQKPFVEFWGDTYGDQYYFIIRKPPFTRKSFLSLKTINISERDVISDSISWSNDTIYSWYQLNPNGNYIGANESLYTYLTAVFFPEYAEIWGSRPLSITSNYITFIKETDTVQMEAVLQDLKFLIDIHSYLPFTRQGTITINGDRRIKRGMRIHYLPTDEYFYVESVSNDFTVNDGVIERTTTLQVSHGMVREHAEIEIEDEHTPSYFNLINYGDNQYNVKDKNKQLEALPKNADVKIENHCAYFNQDKHTFSYDDIDEGTGLYLNSGNIFLGADKLNSDKELKITKNIVDDNFNNCKRIAEVAFKYKSLIFEIIGNTDSVDTNDYNIKLGNRRANTIKSLIIQYYKELYNPSESELKNLNLRFEIRTLGEGKPVSDNKTPLGRLRNRRVDVYIKGDYDINKKFEQKKSQVNKKLQAPKEGNWHVNQDVFLFFMRRKQFMNIY